MPVGEGGAHETTLQRLPLASWEGRVWSMRAPRYGAEDPGGSYLVQGRYRRGGYHFDEAGVFPALYLATAPEVCPGELQRHLSAEI